MILSYIKNRRRRKAQAEQMEFMSLVKKWGDDMAADFKRRHNDNGQAMQKVSCGSRTARSNNRSVMLMKNQPVPAEFWR